jgi:hypothetical protein
MPCHKVVVPNEPTLESLYTPIFMFPFQKATNRVVGLNVVNVR